MRHRILYILCQTDAELKMTRARCAEVKKKSDDEFHKAELERAAIKKDLDKYRNQLHRLQ